MFVDRWPLTVVTAARRAGQSVVDHGEVDCRQLTEALLRESEATRLRNSASTTVNGQWSTKSLNAEKTARPRRGALSTVNRQPSTEDGFTLAGLLVICTILMIFVAYTVPRQWSTIMKREREKQTIFVMKQYARAIKNFQTKNANALPTSLDQLKKARTPRLIRGVNGEWNDPLTGKVDWLLVPPQAAVPPQAKQGQPVPQQAQPPVPKDYVGPFVGVRPPLLGASLLSLNGADRYEQWLYTINELNNEINGLVAGQPAQTTTPPR